ncbi:hypothetical protein C463_05985 [Halorubrum californiense DSM 19288]|uniref:DUF4013 domain-containing protein n=1 Tax=Halorubrum californiense DSM 19288 TaxID=1227465 RepID=M0EGE9_9EURY|nr:MULTISPECIES: DUF4013 domain-containing protein [Halorubrum]ELZ45957.1 hypothetical protein C463_05985 [Halorubrum californiense DSM 19288]TKX72291.1 DUF4013 domain-containing protein [Halorubrum sp. GN11GM_10-3_MGM]
MLTAAATALTRTDDTAGVVLVGGSVTLLGWILASLWLVGVLFVDTAIAVAAPIALAPSLVARGYFVRVTRGAIQQERSGGAAGAPSLVDWGELVRDGVKSAVLSAALLAPLGGGLAVVGGAIAALVAGPVDPGSTAAAVESALGPNGPAAVAVVAVGLVAALVGAYLLAFAYLRPAALAAFAASGRLRDGLNPRTVVGVAATGPYATGWTLAVGALAVGYAVAAPTVPLVGGVALAFLARVVAHGLYGRGAADALTSEETESEAQAAVRTDRDAARSGSRTVRRADATRGAEATRGADAARVAAATEKVERARDDPPAPIVSGDGGQPVRSEPPAPVQVGRGVPVDEQGDAETDLADSADAIDGVEAADAGDDSVDARDDSTDGFEWDPALAEAEDKS